jgi:hypothetical protein
VIPRLATGYGRIVIVTSLDEKDIGVSIQTSEQLFIRKQTQQNPNRTYNTKMSFREKKFRVDAE